MIKNLLILSIFIISFNLFAYELMGNKEPRWVDLAWDPIDKAMSYEVTIVKNNEEEDIVINKVVSILNISVQLTPEKYKFKIRALDERKVPGDWSDWSELDVNLPAPALVSPYSEEKIQAIDKFLEPVKLNWKEVQGAKFYEVLIWNKDKTFKFSTIIEDSSFDIELKTANQYFWIVNSLLENKKNTLQSNENGKPFFLNGGKIDHPQVEISENAGVIVNWEKSELVQFYEVYLFKKQINNKWSIVKKFDQYDKNSFKNKEFGHYRLAVRSVARGWKSSSFAFLEYQYDGDGLSILLNRIQVDVNVNSDNPFFYSYGLETMNFTYEGVISENDTEIDSSLIGYRLFLEGSYQDFYSYFRHRVGVNTHLLKNINEYIYLSELFYLLGQKKVYKKIPYEYSAGIFLREDLFIKANRFDETINYEKIVTSGLVGRVGSWYQLHRKWEVGAELKLYIHALKIKTPNDEDIDPSISYSSKFFLNYNEKENLSYSLFYGLYGSSVKYFATEGDSNDPSSTSIAPSGAINEASAVGTSFGLLVNSSF